MNKKISIETPKSEKKMKKLKELKVREEENDSPLKKSKKNCKALELQVEVDFEPMDVKGKTKKKKESGVDDEGDEDEGKREDPNAISKFAWTGTYWSIIIFILVCC
ncbi:hypothetical protein V6N13_056949 [Hibiscus sabdariffa]|uniref:Uncharacterized protein n=2 Tax=Hibiscus sabdariffa TaxID=183260 RepID=A0ABR1ZLB6_9ROSI